MRQGRHEQDQSEGQVKQDGGRDSQRLFGPADAAPAKRGHLVVPPGQRLADPETKRGHHQDQHDLRVTHRVPSDFAHVVINQDGQYATHAEHQWCTEFRERPDKDEHQPCKQAGPCEGECDPLEHT